LWQEGTPMGLEISQDIEKLKSLATQYDKLQTGGADSHYDKDLIDFAQTNVSSSTEGMLEKILEKVQD
jgi:hypothetical protein